MSESAEVIKSDLLSLAAEMQSIAQRQMDKNAQKDVLIGELLAALEALVDDEECRFDHHGNCQTHALSNPCNMQRARDIITKAKRRLS